MIFVYYILIFIYILSICIFQPLFSVITRAVRCSRSVVKLVNLPRAEAVERHGLLLRLTVLVVDDASVGVVQVVLALHGEGDAAGAAVVVAAHFVRAGNPAGEHQLVAGAEVTHEGSGADVARLLGGVDVEEAFLQALVGLQGGSHLLIGSVEQFAVPILTVIGGQCNLVITIVGGHTRHDGVGAPVTFKGIVRVVGLLKSQGQRAAAVHC